MLLIGLRGLLLSIVAANAQAPQFSLTFAANTTEYQDFSIAGKAGTVVRKVGSGGIRYHS